MPIVPLYLCAGILLVAAMPMPYGYYILVRLIACGVFGFAAFTAWRRGYKVLPWAYGFLAVLFNPIIKIYLPKETWIIVDLAAAALLFTTAPKITAK